MNEDYWDVMKNVKRRDYVNQIMYALETGYINGFVKSYGDYLRGAGFAENEVRKTLISCLYMKGFERNLVTTVIEVNDDEWKELTKGLIIDVKFRDEYSNEIHREALASMEKFGREHPGYFDEPHFINVVAQR